MNKTIFSTGVILGLLAVLLGAFGAHGLEKLVNLRSVATFETGVRYQMYHAFFLLILGSIQQIPHPFKKWIYYVVLLGVILFSGSIYLLAINDLTSFNFKIIAFATPIGGSLLVFGWGMLGYSCLKNFGQNQGG